MAFTSKTDYAGLTTAIPSLTIRDDDDGKTAETYQPVGADGSILAVEVYGEDSNPSNNYGVSANILTTTGAVKLGLVNSVSSKPYALQSLTISTSAGSPVKVSASSAEVETGATTTNVYELPVISVSKAHVAQMLFSAATFTGAALQDCTATCSSSVTKDKIAGTKISFDVSGGRIEVSGTLLQTNELTPPTISPDTTNGWVLTQPLARTNAETAYPTWKFTLVKPLVKSAYTPPVVP